MDENEMNLLQLRAVVIGIAFVIASIAGCTGAQTYSRNAATVEMVKHGADPIAAMCASGSVSDSTSCALVAARKP